ncbi:LL-diaminopimelate aminotransferase [Candidatus Woesearchaeota archaeon]|nr:LL-diaminopimelate aminotransferase [Candidatus Woesearchaeota archaeon]
MVHRNPHLAKLASGYLFPEINRRKREFLVHHPEAKIISLGIGNTTEPLSPHIAHALAYAAQHLATREGYSGYGDEQGLPALREKIAHVLYKGSINPDEVFISDGAKCDLGRLQLLFGCQATIAVQDPTYPVYVDGSVLIGATGHSTDHGFKGVVYMPCTPENNFFPNLTTLPRTDLIYFCSPNNPTGAVATKKQLEQLVAFAKQNKSIIIFDAAYSEYIEEPTLPKSIYEIDGAREVAIEVSSFSKLIGFTGVRLGWCVVPQTLCYDDGTPVAKDWNRIVTTIFNGASNIAQHGGLAALDHQGQEEMKATIAYTKKNARIIRSALLELGFDAYGGINSPYIWAKRLGKTEKSWDIFNELLETSHVVTTPGSGFGPSGEGFLRFSAFGHREDVEEAVQRLQQTLR